MDQRQTRKISVVVLSTILVFLLIKIVSSVNTYRLESQSPTEKFLKSKETRDIAKTIKSSLDEIEADHFDYFFLLNTQYNKRKVNQYLPCETAYKKPHKGTPMVTPQQLRIHFLKNGRSDDQIDAISAMSPEVSPLASYYLKHENSAVFVSYQGLDLDKITEPEPNSLAKPKLIAFKDKAFRIPIFPARFSETIGFEKEGLEQMGLEKICGNFDLLQRNDDGRIFDQQ